MTNDEKRQKNAQELTLPQEAVKWRSKSDSQSIEHLNFILILFRHQSYSLVNHVRYVRVARAISCARNSRAVGRAFLKFVDYGEYNWASTFH